MSSATSLVPGIAAHPDLLQNLEYALRGVNCSGCERLVVVDRYKKMVDMRNRVSALSRR